MFSNSFSNNLNKLLLKTTDLKTCYDNFCESHVCITLYSKFDITTGASVDEIRDTVFNNFYSNVAAR